MVEVNKPPIMIMAIGPSISFPGSPDPMAIGSKARPATKAVIKMDGDLRRHVASSACKSARMILILTLAVTRLQFLCQTEIKDLDVPSNIAGERSLWCESVRPKQMQARQYE